MSETVHYKGKLQHIKKNNGTLLEAFLSILTQEQNIEFAEYQTDIGLEERICEYADTYLGYQKVLLFDGELFLNIECKEIGEFDIFEIEKIDDDIYQYDFMYYNGGCCMEEALEIAAKAEKIDFK